MTTPSNASSANFSSSERKLSRMLQGYRDTQLIYVAAKLRIADHLKDGPKCSGELARAIGAQVQPLKRFMRGLVHRGFVVENGDGRFALTPLGACLQSDSPNSLHGMAVYIGGMLYPAWGDLLHTVQTGEIAFDHVFGMNIYQYISQNPKVGRYFSDSIINLTEDIAQAVLETYDFSSFDKIVDVGGGHGALIIAILGATPQVNGILFDMPAIIADAQRRIQGAGLADRCKAIAGDFFQSIPSGGDAYLLSQVLHSLDDDQCVNVLQNCHKAMAEKGRLLVIELIMPEPAQPRVPGVGMDLIMLVLTGGRERTEAEFRDLLASAGFRVTQIIPNRAGRSTIEAMPLTA